MGTLEEVFGVENLMSPAVSLFGEPEPTPIAGWFKNGVRREVMGDVVRWDREDFSRAIAPFGSQMAPAIRLFPQDRDHLIVPLAQVRIERFLDAKKIFVTHRGLGELQPNAPSEISRALGDLQNRGRRAEEYLCAELLFNQGGATVNSTNVPGSTVTFSLDFAITDVDATASWATETTAILSTTELLGAIDTHIQNSGTVPGRAVHNIDVFNHLITNDQVEAWFQTTPQGVALVSRPDVAAPVGVSPFNIAGGLAGIPNWLNLNHGYLNDGGSFTKYIANDYLLLLPDTDMIFGWAQGMEVVPSVAIGAADAAAAGFDVRPGPIMYAIHEFDPPGVRLVYASSFAPTILLPEACTLIDTTP